MPCKQIVRIARVFPGASVGMALACLAPVAWAQFTDIDRAVRNQLPSETRRAMRDAQKASQRAQAEDECGKLKQWVGSVQASSAGASYGMRLEQLLPYVEDDLFSRHFGKTYDQLTVNDFRNVQVAQRTCYRSGIFLPAEQQIVNKVWNQNQHAQLSQQLVGNRGKRRQVSALLAELDALRARAEDLKRLDAIRSDGTSLSRAMSADERASLEAKIAQTRDRIGPPVMKQRVAEQIADAKDSAGLAALSRLDGELARSMLGRQHTEPLREQLRFHIGKLDSKVAATERSSSPLQTSATGLSALEESKRWLGDFEHRFQPVLSLAPALDGLRREVVTKREAQLAQASPLLIAQVRAAPNGQEVTSLVGRYLSTQEQQSGVGRTIKQAGDDRISHLEHVAKNDAVFGVHSGLPSSRAGVTSETTTEQPASATRCDVLAADPQDPTRIASGVSDDDMVAASAVIACNEAAMQAPNNSRVRFQLGRALLKAGRLNEAVTAFQQAAKTDQPGALAYLATAYEHGAGGVAKSKGKSDELFARAQSLGYGSGSTPRTGETARSTSSTAIGSLSGNYEVPDLVKAIYTADASLLKENLMFTGKYLMSQAEILAKECSAFKLSEVRSFQEILMRKVMPTNSNEAAKVAAENIKDTFKILVEAQRNPQVMVDMGRAEQRLNDAPDYGANDLVEFTKNHGGCGSAPLARYSRNLRAYFERMNSR